MFYDAVVMADLQEQLAEIHEEVVSQVLEDLRNGDRKARAEAMQLLKQNNVTAVAQEGSTLRKLAGKTRLLSDGRQGRVHQTRSWLTPPWISHLS